MPPQVTQPNSIPNQGIPSSAGQAPAGTVPTFGGAGIFTGYAPTPQGNPTAQVGGQSTPLAPVASNPATPLAPTTQPSPTPQASQPTVSSPTSQPPANQTAPQGQFYYTQSTDTNGKPITTYYDGNGNVLPTNPIGGDQYKDNPSGTPNAGGNLVQLPSAPTTNVSQINSTIQGQTQQNQQQLDELNSQSDQAYSQYENQLSQIQSGTYPLTPAQQQLYDSTSQQFDVLRQQQVIANQALTQGTQVAEARSGEQVGGAQTALGNVGAAINTGLQKLAALDSQGSTALANLQSGFQKDDLGLIQDSYSAFQNYQSQKEKTISDIYDATTKAETDLRDFTYKQTQDNVTNTLNSQKEDWTEKYQTMQNQLAQSQLSESERHDIQTEAISAETAANGRYQAVSLPDGTEGVFDKQSGGFVGATNGGASNGTYNGVDEDGQAVTPGNTGIPILDQNTQTTSTGVPYIDGTNLKGAQATAAQYDAAKYGIPYLGAAQASGMVNINAAISDLNQMQTYLTSLNPSNGITRPFVTLGHAIESATQLGPGASDLSSLATFRTDAVKYIQGLASGGTGLRINESSIQNMIDHIPSANDTPSVAQGKMDVLTALLHSNERSIIGEKAYDAYNPNQASTDLAGLYQSNPTMKSQIDTLRGQGLGPSAILQVLLP